MNGRRKVWWASWGALLALALASGRLHAEEPPIPGMDTVTIVEHLGDSVDLSLAFRDHEGNAIRLSELIRGDKPVILTLNYYRCPMLCNLQLNALTDGLKELDWVPGEQFRIVTASIDPRETPELAARKRATHLGTLGKGDVDWTFLVGDEASIRALADRVGFGYKYVPERDEYAHTAAVFVLSPQGVVARYLYGLEYPARDLKFALMEAADGRVGSPVEKLLLSCFVYDHAAGAYAPFAFGIMRLGGGITAAVVGIFLSVFWVRERRQRARTEESQG